MVPPPGKSVQTPPESANFSTIQGLPPIPAPKPLNPRPLRPLQRPFGMLSDGMDGIDNSDGPRYRPRSSCCEENDCQSGDDAGRQWGRGCEGRNSRCPNDEMGAEGCQNYNRGSSFGEMVPRGPPMQANIREMSVDNHGNNFGEMLPRGLPNIRGTNMENREGNFGEMAPRGSMNAGFPRSGCGMNQENENGCPFSQNRVEMGDMGRRNVEESPIWRRGGDESSRGAMLPEPRSLQNVVPLEVINFGPMPDLGPRRPEDHRRLEFPAPEFRPLPPRFGGMPSDQGRIVNAPPPRQGFIPEDVQLLRPHGPALPPFHRMKMTDVKSQQDEHSGVESEVCVVGTEYSVDGLVPSCDLGTSNFCPNSHPHCLRSTSLRSRVCCSQLVRLSKS
ncbi:hypothetical protein Y032_0001g448 [Ancylostoma ceylanicum]|nr:hypothetical protein Y032_0001g448 [Ancylostoma ceylanicum]